MEQGVNNKISTLKYYQLKVRETLKLIKVQYYKIKNQA